MADPVQTYDVIIAGGGIAGRSLAYFLSRKPQLAGTRILLIDGARNQYEHRSLIYWHDGDFPLPLAPAATFKSIAVDAEPARRVLPLKHHSLCLTSSRTVFRCLDKVIDANSHITRLDANISRVRSHKDFVEVTLSDGQPFRAPYCFDSTFYPLGVKAPLLMSGEIRRIRTPQPSFDPSVATFIDFRSGEKTPVHFHCVLPISAREAFVEVTRILPNGHIDPGFSFEEATSAYLGEVWGVTEFSLLSLERGFIPLGIHPPAPHRRHMYIGTPSGVIKATTGYGLTRILRQTESIAASLASTGSPDAPRPSRRFHWYDKPVLRMWKHSPQDAVSFMKAAFAAGDADLVLDFLDEQTTLEQERGLLGSMPVTLLLHPRLWI
ncbi:lycopene cyclase family protein [Arthrobacter agilis]|uniref:lycopene cyclase family protein n=1 Tax=Arthrobacter agilis TaxID=37921 RepID=UPI0027845FC0|nr:lycopene cyclase family protein [Arthrobacter agilis]MDQ0735079.1 lycopene beta-cyclase [Arthrobacter agilis]